MSSTTDSDIVSVYYKHPGAVIDIDFTIVSSDNDTVASIGTVVITPGSKGGDPLEVTAQAIEGATAKIWFGYGEDGVGYTVWVPITTTLGRTEYGKIIVRVKNQ